MAPASKIPHRVLSTTSLPQSSLVPGTVKPNFNVRRLLLVAADSSFQSDFLAALRDGIAAQSSTAFF